MSQQRRPAVGDTVEVEIDKLVAGGEGLGRSDGFVIFARPAYPGDRVRVRLTESHRSFGRGVVVERLISSPERKAQPCSVAEICGGCDWTSYRLDAQLRAKREILLESLVRIGKLDREAIPPIQTHASALNYRLRSRLHVDEQGRAGFYEMRSHRVVPIVPECEVVGPLLRERIEEGSLEAVPGSDLEIVENDRALIAGSSGPVRSLPLTVGPYVFDVTVGAFFQVNRHLLATLIRLVLSHADRVSRRDRALDLYGGVGFFSVPLADRFAHVVSVESHRESSAAVRRNAGPRNVEAVHADVLAFVEQYDREVDMIMLDPPRAGTHPRVIDAIAALAPQRVSYLSCDPVNLARDLARFARREWSVDSIDLIDLFPNTHHIETLVSLRKA